VLKDGAPRHRRLVAAEAGRVREEPDEGGAARDRGGNRTGADAAVNTDAAPPPTPSLRRLHRRPAVSIVATPFTLRRSRIPFLSVGAPSSRRFPSASRRRFPMNGVLSRYAGAVQGPWLPQAARTGRSR
jgi:hypothetical protein